jgi:hypothetical protein
VLRPLNSWGFISSNKLEKMMSVMIIRKDKTFLKNEIKSDRAKIKWYPKSKKLT